ITQTWARARTSAAIAAPATTHRIRGTRRKERTAATTTASAFTSSRSTPEAAVSWIATRAAISAGARPAVRSVSAAGRCGISGPVARMAKVNVASPAIRPSATGPATAPPVRPAPGAGGHAQRIALVNHELTQKRPREPVSWEHRRHRDPGGKIPEVQQSSGDDGCQDAASAGDDCDRGELRGPGEDDRGHQD